MTVDTATGRGASELEYWPTDDDIAAFGFLGLTADALRTYRLMLVGLDSVDLLAQRLDQEPEVVSRLLESLLGKGLIVPSTEDPHTPRPLDPRLGFARLIDEHDRAVRHAHERLDLARDAVRRLVDLAARQNPDRQQSLEMITGRDQITDRIAEVVGEATTDVQTMITMLPSAAALAAAREGDLQLLERGILTRILVLAGHLRRSRDYVDYLHGLIDRGAHVRVAASLPTRLVLVDQELAIVPADPDDPGAAASIVRQRGLVDLLLSLFDNAWDAAAPLEEDSCREQQWEPSELELEVIRLLGRGNKDEAIARRIGMSLRSVRRLVSQISHELGSGSRFELGLICAARGWVSPRDPTSRSES